MWPTWVLCDFHDRFVGVGLRLRHDSGQTSTDLSPPSGRGAALGPVRGGVPRRPLPPVLPARLVGSGGAVEALRRLQLQGVGARVQRRPGALAAPPGRDRARPDRQPVRLERHPGDRVPPSRRRRRQLLRQQPGERPGALAVRSARRGAAPPGAGQLAVPEQQRRHRLAGGRVVLRARRHPRPAPRRRRAAPVPQPQPAGAGRQSRRYGGLGVRAPVLPLAARVDRRQR